VEVDDEGEIREGEEVEEVNVKLGGERGGWRVPMTLAYEMKSRVC